MFGSINERLRKAGSSLRNFDDAYAAKAAEGAHPFVQMSSGLPVTYAPSGTAAEKAVGYALVGVNAGARYALPAGGVTLAGKGLYDLTQMMLDQQSSGTISPDIS